MHPADDTDRETVILALRLFDLKPGLDAIDLRLFPLAERAFWGDHHALIEYARVLDEVGRHKTAARVRKLLNQQPWIDSQVHRHKPGDN